jgi:hypothetical protein
MKRYVIERDLPGIGSLTRSQFKDLAATSNGAILKLSGKVQWVQSFVADDKTFVSTLPIVRLRFVSIPG